jgi:hypothetical protein
LRDLWGKPKPVHGALLTLYPEIPVGAKVVVSPTQDFGVVYSAAFIKKDRIVVGIAKGEQRERAVTIALTNAPKRLKVAKALAYVQTHTGDPAKGDPDRGEQVDCQVQPTWD